MLAGFALSLGLNSCSGDETITDNTTGNENKMSFNISCAPSNSTRSVTGDETDVGTSAEWMRTWKLVIVNANTNKVEYITTNKVLASPLEMDKCDIFPRLSAGKKIVYAFANITDTELTQAGVPITVSDANVDITAIDALSFNPYDATGNVPFTLADGNIPMSNKVEITVTDAESQTFNIPLYRMLAKLSFSFTSEAAEDVTVNSVSIAPATTEGEYLFPMNTNFSAYRTQYEKRPGFPDSYKSAEIKAAWDEYNEVTAGTKTAVVPAPIYINESKGSEYSKHMVITLNTTRGGEQEEENYTITDLAYINRNDWIKIPIVLTDYVFYPQVFYYPPIGGYPEATVTQTDNKTYIVFNTGGGQFAIHPNLYKSNGTDPLTFELSTNIKVDDANPSIFTKYGTPKYDASTGEIIGELGTTTGTATITLTMTVTTGTLGVTKELVRELYIVVAN